MGWKKVETSKRPFEVIFLIDTSYSMKDNKIQSVNSTMSKLEKALKALAKNWPTVQYNIRIITFGGDKAKWHKGDENSACPIENFQYDKIEDSELGGGTPLGDAIGLLCKIFENPNFSDRNFIPLISIISDGKPTDMRAVESNLKKLLANQWGEHALKTAVAIGDADRDILAKFTGKLEMVKSANNAANIVDDIIWFSSSIIKENQGLPGPDRRVQ